MIVKDILLSTRYCLDDTDFSKYSDAELIEALNSVIRYTNASLINKRSSVARTKIKLTPINGEVSLPDNYVSMADFDGDDIDITSYSIVGNKLYADEPMDIIYYSTFTPVSELEDVLPLPNYFHEFLVRFTEAFITKSIGKEMLPQIINDEIGKLSTGRDYPYITREAPFTI